MKASAMIAVVLSLFVAACSKDSTPAPSTTPTTPQPPRFTATLLPANEVPAVTNADASANGNATITMQTTKDSAGTITAATVDFSVTMNGFPAGTTVTAAHIHEGGSGVSGGVKINTGISSTDVTLANGAGGFTKSSINVAPDLATLILANPGNYYFNVHTALNAGGAMRGQLVRAN